MNKEIRQIAFQWIDGEAVKNTKRRRKTALKQWLAWLDTRKITNPRPLDCQKYVKFLEERLADLSVHNTIAMLRITYSYLFAIELIKRNIWLGARFYKSTRQRAQVRPTKAIYSDIVSEILRAQGTGRTPEDVRDRALIYLLFGGGLRRSEAVNANVGDVQEYKNSIILKLQRTKKGKEGVQPLPEWAAIKLMDLVSQRMLEGADETSPLFVDYWRDGFNRISETTVYRIFKRATKDFVDAAPHAARAAFATELIRKGAKYEDVALALRHNDEQMVKVYDKRKRELEDNIGIKISYK